MREKKNLPELIRNAKNGEKEAFGQIYEYLFEKIYKFVYFRVGRKEDAEDLAEIIFLKIWEGLRSYKDRGLPFEAWAFRIARNQVIDFYRGNRKTVSLDKAEEIADASESMEEKIDKKLTSELVLKKIKNLKDSYREIIILKYIQEFDNKEIAKIIDKPTSHVRVLQSRALKALKKILENERN